MREVRDIAGEKRRGRGEKGDDKRGEKRNDKKEGEERR